MSAESRLGGCAAMARRILDATCFTSTQLIDEMTLCQSAFRKTQPIIEDVDDTRSDVNRLLDERLDGGLHAVIDSRRVVSVHLGGPGQGIVLCDVEELDGVLCARCVNSKSSGSFVTGSVLGL